MSVEVMSRELLRNLLVPKVGKGVSCVAATRNRDPVVLWWYAMRLRLAQGYVLPKAQQRPRANTETENAPISRYD